MKNPSAALKKPVSSPLERKCELAVELPNGHLHAANCGHKSYVHAGHICYEDAGKFYSMHEGHAHTCAGPFVQQVTPRPNAAPAKNTGAPAKVISLAAAKKAKTKK